MNKIRSHEIEIRTAQTADIDTIVSIYESAKSYMRKTGNLSQWANGYPAKDDISRDIEKGNLYVGVDLTGETVCAFAFIVGEDPTYAIIDGKWLNDEPYGTIHRIASNGRCSGILARCIDYCFEKVNNVRIDTNRDNRPMLNALAKCGFSYCGVIICADGTPREAFQKIKD